jgi:uncharacterized protein (TIGR02147 family)
MEPIQTYTDYRAFLRDFYKDRKKLNRDYSYRVFCKAAGINSPSLYKEIADGKRNLSTAYLPAFIKGMHLNDRDAKYFMALVKLGHAKTDKEKLEQLEILRGLKPSIRQKLVTPARFEYYSRWYHSVIREIACTMNWKGDYTVLANTIKPKISRKEARESVELLLKLGLIRKNKNGNRIDVSLIASTIVISDVTVALLGIYRDITAEKKNQLIQEILGPPVKVAYDAAGKPTRAAGSFAEKNGASAEKDLELTTRLSRSPQPGEHEGARPQSSLDCRGQSVR